MSTVNWTPKFKNADGTEELLVIGVDQVASSDGTSLTDFISSMESSDLTYTEHVESVAGEPPEIDPVVQNAIQDAVDGITAEQVGALPLTGGTVTGNTTFKNNVFVERTQSDGTAVKSGLLPANYKIGSGDKNNYVTSITHDRNGEGKALFAFNENGVILRDVVNNKMYNLYGEHNKPTAADVGALSTTGGTVTGDLIIKKSSTIASNSPASLVFTTVQTDNNVTTSSSFIKVYDDHDANAYGDNMVIQSASALVIGSGESASACYSTDLVNNAAEGMYITSDGEINFHTNCNTYANKKTVSISNTGALVVPANTDYTTAKARNIYANTTAMTAGTTALANGAIYLQYS